MTDLSKYADRIKTTHTTSDGKRHDDHEAALAHEATLDQKQRIDEFVDAYTENSGRGERFRGTATRAVMAWESWKLNGAVSSDEEEDEEEERARLEAAAREREASIGANNPPNDPATEPPQDWGSTERA